MTAQSTHCANCATEIDEPPNTKPENRKRCPTCGSTTRKFGVTLEAKLEFHDSVRLKLKDAKTRKTKVDQFSGDDLQVSTGKWMDKQRRIDRPQDQYEETVTDSKTGKVIHKCKEPLSKHTGHGTPKKKKTK